MSERARRAAIRDMVREAQRMVEESGNPEGFDAKAWVRQLSGTQNGALRGKRPLDLLDTEEGREQVFRFLRRMQSGAYT